KNSVLVLDLNGQYVYYFEYFREIIHGDASLLYSWTRSLGGEFLGIFAYYLCSPFSLIVALLPKTMMTEALLLLILAKVGMCGMLMALYLKLSRGVSSFTAVLFGTMYALCAYGVIQAMNTMWIDAMYLLPLLLLGCERLIRGRNPLLYCLTLAILMLTNYYIGYMVCIFLVLYFFCYYFSQNGLTVSGFLRAGMRFAMYSLIAAAIAAILLIPAYYGLTFGKTTFQNTNYDFMQRFDFLDFLTKFLPASYDTVRPEGLPVVYSGLLTVLFAPLFFIAPGISNREKVWSGIMCVVLVMSMNASTVDIFWHGLSKPNWLNYRYSFILCFFLIMMAAQAYQRFEGVLSRKLSEKTEGGDAPLPGTRIAYKSLLVVGAALFAMIIMIQKEDYEYIDDLNCIWVSLAFLGGYLITLHPISCGRAKDVGKAFLMAICIGELFVAGLSDLVSLDRDVVYSNRQPYADFMARFRPAVDDVLESDDGLYRMEKTVHRKVNDNMALGIRGISHSTSDLNASVIRYLGELGYASRSHWSKYLGGTPVSDALIGIKYIVAEEEISDLYEEIAMYPDDELFVYENPYTLGIVNTVSAELLEYDPEEETTPFRRLNELVTLMLGEDERVELFKPIDIEKTDYNNCDYGFTTGHRKYSPENENKSASLTYTVKVPTDDPVYIYFPSEWAREVELTLNGEDHGTYFGNETRRIVSLGTFLPGELITLQMTLTEEDLYIGTGVDYFYYLDEVLYAEIMPRLQAYAMEVTRRSDTRIEGTVTTDETHTLIYTSIPYDEGWNVTVDGQSVELVRVADALLAIDASALPEGEHIVVLSYMPKCYVYAFAISVGGIVMLILCMAIRVLSEKLRARRYAMQFESVAPDAPTDGDTACIPLAELLAEVEAE
ncbi:MAG: YfhO family protein, partial [Clostridia bacterium]|nr:YfhO family protein [Clostridia bacterium]